MDEWPAVQAHGQRGQKCPLQYLAFYEAEAESGDAVVARLDETRNKRQQNDSFDWKRGFGCSRKPARNAKR